ncbi:hypothetical protein B0J17DRAFT_678311 [Rhizoctonia solani]|nr:hypothetical protein B0J17DRAFT_678311 [Rhizoctonia solani]
MWQLTRVDNVAGSELCFSDGKELFAIRGEPSTSTRLVISDQGFIDFTNIEYLNTTQWSRVSLVDLNHESISISDPTSTVQIHLVLPGDGLFRFSTSASNFFTGALKPLPRVSKTDIEYFQRMVDRGFVPYPLGSEAKTHEEIRVLGSRYLPCLPHSFQLAMVIHDWTTPSFARMVLMKMFEYTAIPGNPPPIDKDSVASLIFASNWLTYTPDNPDYMRVFLMKPAKSKQDILTQLEAVLSQLQHFSAVENRLLEVAAGSMPRTPKLSVPRLYSGQPDVHEFGMDRFGVGFTQCPLNAGPMGVPLEVGLDEALETFLHSGKVVTTKQVWSFSDSIKTAMSYQNGIVLIVEPPEDGSLLWEVPCYVTPLSWEADKIEWIFPLGTSFTVLATERREVQGVSVLVINLKQCASGGSSKTIQPLCEAMFSNFLPDLSPSRSKRVSSDDCRMPNTTVADRRAWVQRPSTLVIMLICELLNLVYLCY